MAGGTLVNLANCSLNCTLMYRAELALKNALAQVIRGTSLGVFRGS